MVSDCLLVNYKNQRSCIILLQKSLHRPIRVTVSDQSKITAPRFLFSIHFTMFLAVCRLVCVLCASTPLYYTPLYDVYTLSYHRTITLDLYNLRHISVDSV